MKWQRIDDRTERARVYQGWLVKHTEDVHVALHPDQFPRDGYEWRVAICFVPDLNYLEKTKSGNPKHPLYLSKNLTPSFF